MSGAPRLVIAGGGPAALAAARGYRAAGGDGAAVLVTPLVSDEDIPHATRLLPDADLVLMAAGVRPRGELAAAAGLAMHGARVVVDERMRTSADGVLAAGDVAWARNAAAGRHLAVEHWGDALAMGEVAGRTAAGEEDYEHGRELVERGAPLP